MAVAPGLGSSGRFGSTIEALRSAPTRANVFELFERRPNRFSSSDRRRPGNGVDQIASVLQQFVLLDHRALGRFGDSFDDVLPRAVSDTSALRLS